MFFGHHTGFPAILSGGLDGDAVALIARMTSTPNATRQQQISDLIASLKTAGVWDKLDALWVMAASDAQAASLNWKSDNYTLSPVNSPIFTADRGYAGDGATSYLNTNYNPAAVGVNYQRNSATFGLWCRTSAQSANSLGGWFNGTNGTTINARNSANAFVVRMNGTVVGSAANTDGAGLYVGDRTDASAFSLYRNGAMATSTANVSSAVVSSELLIGTATGATSSLSEIAATFAGATLSAGEHASLYSAINQYMTAVGAA